MEKQKSRNSICTMGQYSTTQRNASHTDTTTELENPKAPA